MCPAAELQQHARRLGATATVVLHNGRPLLADGAVNEPVAVQSIRKSLLSALIGIAIEAGKLDLETSLGELGIDDHPTLTETEKTATVGDLLSARSGVYLPVSNQMALPGRPTRGSHPPGTHWYYSNWDFNVLGNIYERVTHKSIYLAFEHHLALPLELQDWDVYEHSAYEYRADPLGGNLTYANYTFALSARDLARFGQLYAQHGSWNGDAVIPSEWVRQSTRPLVATSLEAGVMRHYGHCWWVAGPGAETDPGIPADAFTAWGMNGNFVTVIPSRQLVIVVLVDRTRAGIDRSATGGFVSAADYSRLLSRLVLELSPPGSVPVSAQLGYRAACS